MTKETGQPKYHERDIVLIGSEFIEERARGLRGHVFGGVIRDGNGNPRYSVWVPDLGENWCIAEQDLERTGHLDETETLYTETRARLSIDLEAGEGCPS